MSRPTALVALVALATLVGSAADAAVAQTLRLTPLADAHTDSSQPAVNFGADPELSFGKDRDAAGTAFYRRGHVLFDLTGPQSLGRTPLRATFHWYQSRSSAAGCLDVSLHRVLQPWAEASVTFATQPPHDPVVAATACVGDSFSLGWKSFDVTDLLRDWLTGVAPNHGFVIRDPRESSAGASRPGFGHSRENGNPSLVPYLEVEYGDRFGNPCSMRGAVPLLDVGGGRAAPGASVVLTTVSVITGSQPFAIFGVSRTTWAGGALPFSLGFAGFPFCDLNVSPDVTAGFPALAAPQFDLAVPLPNVNSIVGQTLFAQTLFVGAPVTFEASNGLGVLIDD
ncbi:MAG: DNRLRE domain-containing protein [Planctomycetes bacterium]|nr:DNRLRE domain-containing protein [Planctomycetota bacterium]